MNRKIVPQSVNISEASNAEGIANEVTGRLRRILKQRFCRNLFTISSNADLTAGTRRLFSPEKCGSIYIIHIYMYVALAIPVLLPRDELVLSEDQSTSRPARLFTFRCGGLDQQHSRTTSTLPRHYDFCCALPHPCHTGNHILLRKIPKRIYRESNP